MKKILVTSLILSVSLSSFAQELTLDKVKQIANSATKEFTSTLKKELKKAKRDNGIVSMTDYCIDDSNKILEKMNQKLGPKVSIKRVSLNNRNEKAKASEGEKKILQAFDLIQQSDAYQPDEIVQIVDDNTYKVYSSIPMNSRDCKKCHGLDAKVNKDSKKRFFQTYKNNNGYGYKSGDIRGAVVITISK